MGIALQVPCVINMYSLTITFQDSCSQGQPCQQSPCLPSKLWGKAGADQAKGSEEFPCVLQLGTGFPLTLEAPHVVDMKRQVWAGAVSAGPDGSNLNATYRVADTTAFQDSLGQVSGSVHWLQVSMSVHWQVSMSAHWV